MDLLKTLDYDENEMDCTEKNCVKKIKNKVQLKRNCSKFKML